MNLTTLANIKLWLPTITGTTASDALLTSLMQRCSSQILAYLNRPDLVQTTFTDQFDGLPPSGILMLKNWPVLSVSSVMVNGTSVPQASGQGQPGWTLSNWDGSTPAQPQRLGIIGYGCPSYQSGGYGSSVGYTSGGLLVGYRNVNNVQSGFQNLSVTYSAGYVTQNEKQTILAASSYNIIPNQPLGIWAADSGVVYASTGIALTAVSSNPTQGQYVPPQPWAANPTYIYTFAAADANQAVLLSYSFIPYSLEQGCIEWVGERYKYSNRIGIKSQGIQGQETTSFQMGMPEAIKMEIEPYRRMFPL